MNAVVQFQPATATPAHAPVPQYSFADMEHVANAIARGGLFGSKDPYAVLTLCMLAQAEGQHPVVVMRDYDMIQGKPSKKSRAMLSDFQKAGGRVEWHRLDDDCADATFSHPLGGSVRITWDNARVKQAGLEGKEMHRKFPRAMKRARVVSEGVQTVFPAATSGLYTPEEVADFAPEPAATKPAVPTPQRARTLDAGREKAEGWVRDHIAQVENAADGDALDAIMAGGHKAVAKLAREHADLHAQVQAAYEARGQALAGYADDALPTPTDDQHGEQHTDADHGTEGAE